MKSFFLFLLLAPVFSNAQKTSFFSVAVGAHVPKTPPNTAPGIGISQNFMVTEDLYAGAALSFIRFKKPGKVYVPLTGSITYFLDNGESRMVPFIQGDAGYGFYNNTVDIRKNVRAEMKGGFTASAAVGIKLHPHENSKLQPFLSTGLSAFHFNNTYTTTDAAGNMTTSFGPDLFRRVSVKAGFMF